MSDLVRALAFAFRRKGQDALAGHDLRFVLAFDLRWLAPEDAKRAVARGLEVGLLSEEGGLVRPTFDPHAIDVPLNFRPGPGFLEEPVPADLPAPRPKGAAPAQAPAPQASAPSVPAPAGPPPAAPPAEAAQAQPPPPPPDEPDDALVQEERQRRGRLVTHEVAALVVARRAGEDVREKAARMAQAMLTGA